MLDTYSKIDEGETGARGSTAAAIMTGAELREKTLSELWKRVDRFDAAVAAGEQEPVGLPRELFHAWRQDDAPVDLEQFGDVLHLLGIRPAEFFMMALSSPFDMSPVKEPKSEFVKEIRRQERRKRFQLLQGSAAPKLDEGE